MPPIHAIALHLPNRAKKEKQMKKRRLGIRGKISLGFSILTAMLIIMGTLSIIELSRVGHTFRTTLDESYRSIQYCNQMQLALAEERFALLLTSTSHTDIPSLSAKRIYFEAHEQFENSMHLAELNITQQLERGIIDSTKLLYSRLHTLRQRILSGQGQADPQSIRALLPIQQRLTQKLDELLQVNQSSLYRSVTQLEQRPHSAFKSGLITIIIGILFTLMFTFLVRKYYVLPIKQITTSVEKYLKINHYQPVQLTSKDELLDLRSAVDSLVAKTQAHRTSLSHTHKL